ncbi:hypothetical protein BST61_g256 [Cercospora zeina]
MPTKRSSGDARLQPVRSSRSSTKRSKLSPPSRPVDPLTPKIVVGGSDKKGYIRSIESGGRVPRRDSSASGSTSTLGNEADAAHEDDDSHSEYITTVRASATRYPSTYVKPDIDPDVVMAYAKELESRLHAFLPKLRQANQKLVEQSAKLNMEHVDDGEQHIEMNLNLGILEQKLPAENATATGEICLPNGKDDEPEESLQSTEENVSSLLNGKKDQARPSIELLDAADTADAVETSPQRSEAENS